MFSDFIDEYGVPRLAEICGVSTGAVHLWKHRNRIPRSKWHLILRELKREGVTFERLVELETASLQRA